MVSIAQPIIIPTQQDAIDFKKKEEEEYVADGASFEEHIVEASSSSSSSSSPAPSSPEQTSSGLTAPVQKHAVLQNPSIYREVAPALPSSAHLTKPKINAPPSPSAATLSPLLRSSVRQALTTSDVEGFLKDRTEKLATLQRQLDEVTEQTKSNDMEQFWLDVQERVKQLAPSSSTVQKSSANRMQEEAEKKRLLAEWKRGNAEAVDQQKKDVLKAQEDISNIKIHIVAVQKDIADLRKLAARDVSSHLIMRTERKRREGQEKRVIKEEDLPPLAFMQPPPKPPLRSHQERMREQARIKAQAKAAVVMVQ